MGAFKNAVISASFASLALAHGRHEKRGTLPVDGTIYTACVTPGQIALTFDDGPFTFTQKIVDQLTAAGHKGTFFQNGLNYDSIFNYNDTLKSMISGGHQVASHTWGHADLTTLDAAGITDQMGQLEAAHLAIIGKAPTYVRPPYLATNDLAVSTLKSLGYKIISVNIDTQDWAEGPIGEIQLSIDWYKGNLTAGGSISLNHDPYQATADTFIPAIITYLDGLGLKSVTVGTCLGDDEANWYRGGPIVSSSTISASSTPAPSSSVPAGNGTVPTKPTSSGSGSYPTGGHGGSGSPTGSGSTGYPTGSHGSGGSGGGHWGSGGSGPWGSGPGWPQGSGSWAPKPVKGGDTECGHGVNAGRGALPGHSGEGGAPTGHYGTPGNSTGSGISPYSTGTSGLSPQPSYYTNGASGLTASAFVIGAAVLALVL